VSKNSSPVDESAKSGTLQNDPLPRNSQGARRRKASFLERLAFTEVVPDCGIFIHEQLGKLTSMAPDEQKWKNKFFDSLINQGLLIELQRLPTEELRQFVFMQEEEQGKWRTKLAERKAQREQRHVSEPHGQQTQKPDKVSDKPLARPYKQGKDKVISMEVRMLPAVREYVDALSAHNGMLAQRFVERLIVDTINQEPDHVKHGQQLLKEHGGSLTRATRHAQEEELARLRAAVGASSSPQR